MPFPQAIMCNQDEMPIKDRTTAEGHSVRAMYLMSGAADVAAKRNDEELKNVCRRVFESYAEVDGECVLQNTAYPENGRIEIKYGGKKRVAVRIPGWCESFKISAEYELKNGYAYIDGASEFTVEFDMPVSFVRANKHVHENAGRVAVMRGPVVYCAEGLDNGKDLADVRVDIHGECSVEASDFILPQIKTTAYRDKESDLLYETAGDEYEETPLTLIPYYAFANRGKTDMQVWFLKK